MSHEVVLLGYYLVGFLQQLRTQRLRLVLRKHHHHIRVVLAVLQHHHLLRQLPLLLAQHHHVVRTLQFLRVVLGQLNLRNVVHLLISLDTVVLGLLVIVFIVLIVSLFQVVFIWLLRFDI